MIAALFFAFASFSASAADLLYDNGNDGSPLVSFIQGAKTSIDIEIYTMKDLNVIAELKKAMARGAHLRIIQTPNPYLDGCPVFVKATSSNELCNSLREFVDYVQKNGGEYVPFQMALCGQRNDSDCFQHGKLLIADRKTVLVSSGNFDATNLCDADQNPSRCNRDFTITTTNAGIVKTFLELFESDLKGSKFNVESLLATVAGARVTVSPFSLKPLVEFLDSAQKSIQIENQYLNDQSLNKALMAAAKRGVKVFVMVSSVTAYGKLDPVRDRYKIDQWMNNFTAFDESGIKTRIFTDAMTVGGKPGYLHAKAILVDGKKAWIGSVNGSTQSISDNREYGIFSSDPGVVKKLGRVLYADFVHPKAESWQESLKCKKDVTCMNAPAEKLPETIY